MTIELEDGFEDALAAAVLDDVEAKLVGDANNLVHRTVQHSHDILEAYGARLDYRVEPIIDSFQTPEVERTDRSITVRYGWDHEAAPFFAMGASPHTIEGNPLLSFIWEDAPPEIHDMFPNTERVDGDPRVFFQSVEHPGLPESRFIRAGLEWLRQEVA